MLRNGSWMSARSIIRNNVGFRDNQYSYGGNNPVFRLDSTGLEDVEEIEPGTEVPADKFGGGNVSRGKKKKGKVTVRTGVTVKKGADVKKNSIALSFMGDNCSECDFIQFVWREIIITR